MKEKENVVQDLLKSKKKEITDIKLLKHKND